MNQPKVKYSLSNWDLVTVNPNYKTWNWKDLFCFWGVNIQSVIGFSLIASLYIIYSLNTLVVFFGGQTPNVCHCFMPVSYMYASGIGLILLPLR